MVDDKIKNTFESIKAEPELKASALSYILTAEKQKKTRRNPIVKGFGIAAASIFAVLIVAGFNIYYRETAYISIDINPSIALSINDYGRVFSVATYNEEAEQIVKEVPLRNKTYEEAVDLLMNSDGMQPYFIANSDMWVGVQANDTQAGVVIEETLQAAIADTMLRHHPNVSVEYCNVSEQMRIDAETEGLSATKYAAIKELQDLDSAATVEHYKHSSMHEINQKIADHHAECTQPHGNGKGHGKENDHEEGAQGNGEKNGRGNTNRGR